MRIRSIAAAFLALAALSACEKSQPEIDPHINDVGEADAEHSSTMP